MEASDCHKLNCTLSITTGQQLLN